MLVGRPQSQETWIQVGSSAPDTESMDTKPHLVYQDDLGEYSVRGSLVFKQLLDTPQFCMEYAGSVDYFPNNTGARKEEDRISFGCVGKTLYFPSHQEWLVAHDNNSLRTVTKVKFKGKGDLHSLVITIPRLPNGSNISQSIHEAHKLLNQAFRASINASAIGSVNDQLNEHLRLKVRDRSGPCRQAAIARPPPPFLRRTIRCRKRRELKRRREEAKGYNHEDEMIDEQLNGLWYDEDEDN